MNTHPQSAVPWPRFLRFVLVLAMATAPSAGVLAQGYGAQQAVRQRVQGLEGRPPERSSRPARPLPEEPGPRYDSASDRIDTTYVTPGAVALVVVRPAQLMTAPIAELLPTEVATAAGLKYFGIDPADVDQLTAFVDTSDPGAPPAYGLTIQFNKPFRGAAIPPEWRAHTQLAELAGMKYLQSANPMMPSFYGQDKQTLVIAPDATLRQLVESRDQPKSGPLIDRLREVPAGHDFYLTVDVASLRPLIQKGLSMVPAGMPADAKGLLEVPNLIAAAEFTLNVSQPGPTSLVLHANDENAAQQLETMVQNVANKQQATPGGQPPGPEDPVAQALARYRERMSQSFGCQRDGASLICFHIDGRNPAQQQLVSSSVVLGSSMLVPILEAAREAAEQSQTAEMAESPEAEPGPLN